MCEYLTVEEPTGNDLEPGMKTIDTDIVSVYTDGQHLEMSLDDVIKDVIAPTFHPRRCIGCGISLEYYDEMDGVEGWYPVMTTSMDYRRCEECADAFRIAETEEW